MMRGADDDDDDDDTNQQASKHCCHRKGNTFPLPKKPGVWTIKSGFFGEAQEKTDLLAMLGACPNIQLWGLSDVTRWLSYSQGFKPFIVWSSTLRHGRRLPGLATPQSVAAFGPR